MIVDQTVRCPVICRRALGGQFGKMWQCDNSFDMVFKTEMSECCKKRGNLQSCSKAVRITVATMARQSYRVSLLQNQSYKLWTAIPATTP